MNTQYENLLYYILRNGRLKGDRTGTGTLSTFGTQMRFDLNEGFPLITTKFVSFKALAIELLWFLRGDTNTKFLVDNGVKIWNEWADENGDLGPIYGSQWRKWKGAVVGMKNVEPISGDSGSVNMIGEPVFEYHDQIAEVIKLLRTDPNSRRIIVNAWNVAELKNMALTPCHAFFQFYSVEMTVQERRDWLEANGVALIGYSGDEDFLHACLDEAGAPRRQLSCQLTQRSVDLFLGAPFNIASYALLTHLVAQQTDHAVGELVWVGGDTHLYVNHIDQAKEQISRTPFSFPKLHVARRDSIDEYVFEDFQVTGYEHHPAIKAPIAV